MDKYITDIENSELYTFADNPKQANENIIEIAKYHKITLPKYYQVIKYENDDIY